MAVIENGDVGFVVNVPEKDRKKGFLTAIIGHALHTYGGSVKTVTAGWNGSESDDALRVNFDVYQNAMSGKQDTPEDRSAAAFKTPTGRVLEKLGFTVALVKEIGLTQVKVTFSRPKLNSSSK